MNIVLNICSRTVTKKIFPDSAREINSVESSLQS